MLRMEGGSICNVGPQADASASSLRTLAHSHFVLDALETHGRNL